MNRPTSVPQLARRTWQRLQGRVRLEAHRATYGWWLVLMSSLRKRWTIFRHPHATVSFGDNVYVGPGFSLAMWGNGSLIVGDGVELRRDFCVEIGGSGRVVIGDRSVFTYGAVIQCSTTIEIGERCMVGQGVLFVDGNHRFRDLSRPPLEQGYDFRPLRIGDDVSVMAKCTVIADIGERAFVGANSVVSKPVGPFTLALGAPAREIEYFGPVDDGVAG